jgi:H+/Cl- antiporter ClcA
MDPSGNINFDARGSILLSEVQRQRDKIRNAVPIVDFAKKNENFTIAISVVGAILGVLVVVAVFITGGAWLKNERSSPTPIPSQIHPASSSIWYYLIVGFVLGFAGYLIGVASTPTG